MNSKNTTIAKKLVSLSMMAGLLSVCLAVQAASPTLSDDDPPKKKPTIKEIMKEAHKDGLIKKVATGKATEKQTKRLHELYKEMAKLSPPKGDKKSWDEKTKALVDSSKAAVDKDPNFKTKLKNASNCSACHKIHKS